MKSATKLFYQQDAVSLARSLIGNIICREMNNGLIIPSKIVETEAYLGEEDTACHASKGKTQRTQVMYEEGGVIYIYLIYGMYHMLNIVSGPENHPQAVLIRGIQSLEQNKNTPRDQIKTNGPGKLCRYLDIDKKLNGLEKIS